MFKKFLIISLVISISQILFCQQGWYQLTSGTSNNLRSVYFTDINTGYAVGYGGTILKTTNGGLNWISSPGLTSVNLYSVHFIGQTGYAVGGSFNYSSVILKTTNGGINWTNPSSAGYYGFSSVFMTDSVTAYIAANWGILKTTNGGNNWYSLVTSQYLCYFSIYFINSSTGFVTWRNCIHPGGGTSITVNGGSNWSSIGPEGGQAYFINSMTGFVLGFDINRTTNGGTNWFNQFLGSNIIGNWICFSNETTGYIAAYLYPSSGKIFKSTNTGINWLEQTIPQSPRLYSIQFTDINTGYAVGDTGTILKTTNGGFTALNTIRNEIPKEYKLFQNYPNPFNPVTKIKFDVPNVETTRRVVSTKLIIYDILGREVAILMNEELQPGTYEVEFDGENYPSGVYFYKLISDHYFEAKKMVLIR